MDGNIPLRGKTFSKRFRRIIYKSLKLNTLSSPLKSFGQFGSSSYILHMLLFFFSKIANFHATFLIKSIFRHPILLKVRFQTPYRTLSLISDTLPYLKSIFRNPTVYFQTPYLTFQTPRLTNNPVFQTSALPPARADLREVRAGDLHPPGSGHRRRGRLLLRVIQRGHSSLFKTGTRLKIFRGFSQKNLLRRFAWRDIENVFRRFFPAQD